MGTNERSGDVRTYVRTTRAKIVITTGRDCGSASWINIAVDKGYVYEKKLLRIYARL